MSKQVDVSSSALPAIVDDADFELVSKYSWCLGGGKRDYVHGRVDGRNHKMARLILNFPSAQVIHRNGNKLDHRRENLALATHQQTTFRQPLRSDNHSGYKGVSWDKERLMWYAYISVNGKTKPLGRYANKEDAATAYNIAALEIFGDKYAGINIIGRKF